jgi:hypothetical protein
MPRLCGQRPSTSVLREICFWLLTGPNGGEVCKLALPTRHTRRVAEAIYVLRKNFVRPIRIEQLAVLLHPCAAGPVG